ncbi:MULTISPECIES: type VI secretion system Vgr family protein [Acinetobacter]|uniref:Type VI secretion system tip protein VgrG n=1 Tax=Acinetobacter piscicola TaxID=2006115 RepID=A0A7S6VY52_9GAMM|nr:MULTISPECIES: type VI secretion system Vgr family protein [Acinetobacter]QOW47036.1 type VI secretion system tip protein VgrG [Acinetobacter piscicola]
MNHQIKLFGEALPISPYGTAYFWFDSLSGTEKINELFEYHLIVKVRDEYHNPAHGYRGLEGFVSKQTADNGGTPGSDLNLQSLIGTEIAVRIRLDGLKVEYSQLGLVNNINGDATHQTSLNGARFYRGLVNRVEVLPVRNRHATYKITLVPWLWLLTKTSNYKIYQKKTVLQIIEEVLERYPYPVEYRCSADYPILDFQAQYGEDDFSFIQRLMQEHGINFHFEHSQNHLTLVLSDHNAAFKEMDAEGYRKLSIYPPNQRFPNQAEYIEFFEPAQQLVSGKVQLSDFQFKKPSLTQTAQDQFLWDHHFAEQEIYEWQQGDFISAEDGGELKAKQRVEQLYQHGYRAQGKGHLKGLQTGYRFNLENHPNADSNRSWLVLGTQTTIQDLSEERADNQFYDSKVEFLVQPDAQIFRPDKTIDKPQGRPQTATVVGPAGEEIYTDQFGRVKVQFHWDRLGAKDQNSTCWLRVSTAWAGNNFGTIHLPRIGQEVIVDFFNGDPDMPFVAGRLTNPEHMPLWELPEQKALSGIKSKELGGSQANQLVMDDTQGQVQVHLKSDHQASELNLGYITRIPEPSGRKDYRGQGFELRTDGHGVLRANKGLLITSQGRSEASGFIKEAKEAALVLDTAYQQHLNLANSAVEHKNQDVDDQSETVKAVQALNQAVYPKDKQDGELQNPQVVMHSPTGVNLASEKTTQLANGEHISLAAGQHISMSAGKNLLASVRGAIRLFSQLKGIRLFTAKEKIELNAQTAGIDVLAQEKVQIHSHGDWVEITAKQGIMINAGGSYIKITPDGIEHGTTGGWKAQAADHKFEGPASQPINSESPLFNDEMFVLKDINGDPITGFKYKVIDDAGNIFYGITDNKGQTDRIFSGAKNSGLNIYPDDRGILQDEEGIEK